MKRIDQIKEIPGKTLFTLPAESHAVNTNNGAAPIFRTLARLLEKIMLLLAQQSLAKHVTEPQYNGTLTLLLRLDHFHSTGLTNELFFSFGVSEAYYCVEHNKPRFVFLAMLVPLTEDYNLIFMKSYKNTV